MGVLLRIRRDWGTRRERTRWWEAGKARVRIEAEKRYGMEECEGLARRGIRYFADEMCV